MRMRRGQGTLHEISVDPRLSSDSSRDRDGDQSNGHPAIGAAGGLL